MHMPMTPAKQWVNPLAAGSGSINPGADFSQGQSRKQWLTGWKVAKAVLDALLNNLSVRPDRCVSAHVMYGYDSSVAEAVYALTEVASQRGRGSECSDRGGTAAWQRQRVQ